MIGNIKENETSDKKLIYNRALNCLRKLKKNKFHINYMSNNSENHLMPLLNKEKSHKNSILQLFEKNKVSSLSNKNLNVNNIENYSNNNIKYRKSIEKGIISSRNKYLNTNSNSNINSIINKEDFEEEKINLIYSEKKPKLKINKIKRIFLSCDSLSKGCSTLASNSFKDNIGKIENPEDLHFFNVIVKQKIKNLKWNFENVQINDIKIGEYI